MKEINKYKVLYLSIILFAFLYLIYRYTFTRSPVHLFYSALLSVSLIFVVIDMFLRDESIIDTVTIENPKFMTVKQQLVFASALSILLAFWMGITGQALVKANPFGIVFQASPTLDALDSAIMGGIVETIFFFGVIYPTLTNYMRKVLFHPLAADIVAMIAASLIFMMMHNAVYGYNEPALLTVFLFAFIFNVVPIYITKSLIIPTIIHATNNFLVVTLRITQMAILFLI